MSTYLRLTQVQHHQRAGGGGSVVELAGLSGSSSLDDSMSP